MRAFGPLLIGLGLSLGLVACGDKDGGDSGEPVDTDTDDGSEDTGDDIVEFTDADHDGYWDTEDCDDNNYAVNPGAEEKCDGIDNNCNDEVDEGFDVDGDGHTDASQCDEGDDCDDADATIYTGADEVPYDGIDQDCDGDDLIDADGDGFTGMDAGGNDCDDADATIYPGADEVSKDGIDQDCNGDDSYDGDYDGHEDDAYGGDDCDDSDPSIHPEAWEWFNDSIDSDCDGKDEIERDLVDAEHSIAYDDMEDVYFASDIAVCDLDEDGVDDVIIAARGYDAWMGQIYIYYGRETLRWTDKLTHENADVSIESEGGLIAFGVECGDFDGDGHMDIVAQRGAFFTEVAEDYFDIVNDLGLIFWYGDGSQYSDDISDADADAEMSYDLGLDDSTNIYSFAMTSGDIDGDGAADILVNMYEDSSAYPLGVDGVVAIPGAAYSGELDVLDYWSGVIYATEEGSILSVEIVEDIDGDGGAEIVMREPEVDSNDGKLSIFSGMPSGENWLSDGAATASFVGPEGEGTYFGYWSAFGDFDADGATDMMVSAPTNEDSGYTSSGMLYVLLDVGTDMTTEDLDADTLVDDTSTGRYESGQIGLRTWSVGDFDANGHDEVLVLEPFGGSNAQGRLRLIDGSMMDGTLISPEEWQTMAWDFESGNGVSLTGRTFDTGDVDGDGLVDMIIGAQYQGYQADGFYMGKAYLVLGADWYAEEVTTE